MQPVRRGNSPGNGREHRGTLHAVQDGHESIEARKREIRKERERELLDPSRWLWRDLVRRAYDPSAGFATFSLPEKQYFSVNLLQNEVWNGGFHQYFFNSSGSYYTHALAGLKNMGALRALALLEEAKQVVFRDDHVPEETRRRRMILVGTLSEASWSRLGQLDDAYCKDPDGLELRIEEFAHRHQLI